MGLFNSIFADVTCPVANKVCAHTEIQIKWQAHRVRGISSYYLGDILEELEDEYNNTWIRTDYICDACSKHTIGRNNMSFIKTEDQQRHLIFVRIENARICEIVSEQEFQARGIQSFVDYL